MEKRKNEIRKWQIEKELIKIVKKAKRVGIEICVATDPEGNGYHTLNQNSMIFGGAKMDKIVLSVWEFREEDELFNL